MLDVGIVGCGAVVHQSYATALRGRAAYRVCCVSDVVPKQAESAARLFGAEATTVESLVSRSDAIVITTPPDTHADLVRRVAAAGKIVLCEKPFATSYADAVDVAGRAAAAGARLFVGHFRRTFPQLELARSLIRLGLVGEITGMFISEGGRFTWRPASDYVTRSPFGGVLWDTGSHSMDMALFAAGLDEWLDCEVTLADRRRDKAEPSHDFRAAFSISGGSPRRRIDCRLHVSRKDVLPNLIRLTGTSGSVVFTLPIDRAVRLTTSKGSIVLTSERQHLDLRECFDLQIRRILLEQKREFEAERFFALTRILETLAND